MKRFAVVLLAGLMLATPASAKWRGRHHHGYRYAADVTAGIVGTAAGVMLAESLMHPRPAKPKKVSPRVYIYEPEGKCYTVVSRKTGKITQKCVENASDEIIYVD